MADPTDPDQALRKRLTAQLAPAATNAVGGPDLGTTAPETPLSADPVASAPFPSTPNAPGDTFNGVTWVGGGASGVTPEYGNQGTGGQSTGTYSWPAPEVPLSAQPLPGLGTPEPQQPIPPNQPFPTGPGHYPTPPPPIPPDQPVPGGPGHFPGPVGSSDNPQMTYPPGQTLPTGPSHPIGGFSASAAPMLTRGAMNTAAGTPQQQLRQRLFSHLARRRPIGRF